MTILVTGGAGFVGSHASIGLIQAGHRVVIFDNFANARRDVAAQLAEHSGQEALTPKEIDVLRLIAAGNANKEIAARLSITEETVKSRVKNILDKLGANDRTHAVTIGAKRGIIEL